MDPASLSTAALTILAPFVKDAGEDLVKTAGQIGLEKARDLFTWMKEKFAHDPTAASDLSRFAADPETFKPGLQMTIKQKVERDPQFTAELKKKIDDIGPMITVFQEISKGNRSTGVDAEEIGGSAKVEVTQKGDEVEDLTGIRAKRIG